MAEKTLQIEVQEDHLERISQTKKPILAIAELVWNALDADASKVTISLVTRLTLAALRAIRAGRSAVAFITPIVASSTPLNLIVENLANMA